MARSSSGVDRRLVNALPDSYKSRRYGLTDHFSEACLRTTTTAMARPAPAQPPKPSPEKSVKQAAKPKKARSGGNKKRRARRKDSYSRYIYRVLKQVQKDTGISSKAMSIMESEL
ncbi:unnamed protein product [Gongylonema pulchrum]|uniref:Histone domain-containing protein n=1 Tax=Gongylonema pulchrum TaxID=637853 RepID=A0A183EA85_9BILA|nr:unnamed protein product [Gongylonema pulchrum]